MTDPERLSRSPAHSLAALLLQAGAEEKPSAAVLRRTTEAVAVIAATAALSAGSAGAALVEHAAGSSASASGLAAASSAASAAGLSGATLGFGAVAKWIAIGALGGGVAVSSVQALITEQGTKHAQAIPIAGTNAASTRRELPQATAAARPAPTLIASADAKEPERPAALGVQKAPNSGPSLGEVAKPEASTLGHKEGALLAEEVRFVDQGRAALQRAAFAEALERLASYEGQFPHQQLLTEVLFLRMESLSRLGNVDRARALAARLLTLGVAGRQAAQAREVLAPSAKATRADDSSISGRVPPDYTETH